MRTLAAVDVSIPLLGLLLVLALFFAGFDLPAQGCLAGAVLVTLDWLLLRVLFKKVVDAGHGPSAPRILAVALLGFKFILLAGLFYLAIRYMNFDPLGMVIGVSAMPLGIIAGALVSFAGGKEKKDSDA